MREGGVSVENVEHTGRDVALLSGMNYRRFFDSWCRLCGKYRLCQVNFEKASIFGQRQSAWPFWEQPKFSLFHLFFCSLLFSPFLSTVFLSFNFSFSLCFLSSPLLSSPLLSSPRSVRLTCTSLTAASANRHCHCLSTHPTDEAAFPFLLEYLYKFIGGCLY